MNHTLSALRRSLLLLVSWCSACGDDASAVDAGRSDAGAAAGDAALADAGEPPPLDFTVENLEAGETLRYPLAFVEGTITTDATELRAAVGGESLAWPIVSGRFKALVRLAPGDNTIELRAGESTGTFELAYEPSSSPRYVRMLLLLASDGDGRIIAPPGEPNDEASARARIGFGGELMQTYVAESLYRQGMGRRTFALERDDAGEVVVETYRASRTTAELLAMEDVDVWYYFYDQLAALPDRELTIDVAFMGFTTYDGMELRGHAALGGGRFAMFGSSALYTWAEGLAELLDRFSDGTLVDTTLVPDDSVDRRTYWANYSTTLGATMHELGHALSLPHPLEGDTIMSRGFDRFNRVFLLSEPASATGEAVPLVPRESEPGWHPGSAARLRWHRYLVSDDREFTDASIAFTASPSAIAVSSEIGLREVELHVDGTIAEFVHFESETAAEHRYDLDAAVATYGAGRTFRVTAIDDQGNIGESEEVAR
jgi:hypothetical protein